MVEPLPMKGSRSVPSPKGRAARTARAPGAQVVLDAALARLAEQAPRLPAGLRHHRDIWEFGVGVLRAIAAAQRVDHADDLAPFFEAGVDECRVHQMRDERVRRDED